MSFKYYEKMLAPGGDLWASTLRSRLVLDSMMLSNQIEMMSSVKKSLLWLFSALPQQECGHVIDYIRLGHVDNAFDVSKQYPCFVDA